MTNIYINGDNNVVNVTSGQRHYWPSPPARGYRSRSSATGNDVVCFLIYGGIFLAVLIVTFWWLVLGIVILVAVSYATHLDLESRAQAKDKKRRRQAAWAARADAENAAYVYGDSRGTYGDYQPEKL